MTISSMGQEADRGALWYQGSGACNEVPQGTIRTGVIGS
jgi:hypothetical protein